MNQQKNIQLSSFWAVALVLCSLLLAGLACAANATNMTVQGTPKYICPSSTPRPTDVMPPPAPPSYPMSFSANLDYYFVDPNRSSINVQYILQNAGWMEINYWGTYQNGLSWVGNGGLQNIAFSGNWSGNYGSYGVFIPSNVVNATITVASGGGATSFYVVRYSSAVSSSPNSSPCCLPAPIYPTPRPTYTPYPTPTLFKMEAPETFFLDDPIYNYQGLMQLRLRMKSPIVEGSFPIFPIFTAATWNLEITNVGQVEFDFLGGLETYASEVEWNGQIIPGIWSPSHEAAQFLGIIEQAYYPRAVMPGQTVSVKVAAWIPATSHLTKVSLVLDAYQAGDPGYATFVPGSSKGRLITWRNQINTICQGEIQYP